MLVVTGFVLTSRLLFVVMPPNGTPLSDTRLRDLLPHADQTKYSKFTLSGKIEIGRGEDGLYTKLTFIPPSDPASNPPFSTEYEYDPVTDDEWQIARTISVNSNPSEAIWVTTTAKQMENGLWVNTTRTLMGQRQAKWFEQADEFGEITLTAQYVSTPTSITDLSTLIKNGFTPVNQYFGLLRKSTIAVPYTLTEYEADPVTHDFWKADRVLATSPDYDESGTPYVLKSVKYLNVGLWLNIKRTLQSQNVLTSKRQSAEFQEVTDTVQYILTPTVTLTALGYLIENEYQAVNSQFGLQRTSTFNGPITKTDLEFDPETRDPITTTRTLTTTNVSTQNPWHIVTSRQINQTLFLITDRLIVGGGTGNAPSSRSLPGYTLWEIPSLLISMAVQVGVRADLVNVAKVTPILRAGGWRDVPCTVITDYFATAPTPSALWIPVTTNITYSGFALPIPTLSRVLTDTLTTIFINFASTDPIWPSLSETYSITATAPISTTDYLAAVAAALTGTQQLVKEEVVPWRGMGYRRTQTWISPQ